MMEENQFSRTEFLIGRENVEKLKNSNIAIFGLGGVGSFVCEGLARAGVGSFVLVDSDVVSVSNINRQIFATNNTVGLNKIDVAKNRILEINPSASVKIFRTFYMPNCKEKILDSSVDYIVDAIDTVTAKIELIMNADKLNIPIISCMGTGNKLDPTKFEVTDIFKTSVCPLAKVIRKELKLRGIKKLKVVYSKEEQVKTNAIDNEGKKVPSSISFVPSVAGMIIAGEVIKDIIK